MLYDCSMCNKMKDSTAFPPSGGSWCRECSTEYYRKKNNVKSPRTPDVNGQRVCGDCKVTKPLEKFRKNKKCANGRERKCNMCTSKKRSAPDQVANQKRLGAKWYQENRERILAEWKDKYAEPEFQKASKAYQHAYYKDNSEEVKARNNKWREANPEKSAEYTYRRHIWAIRNGNNDLTAEQIKDLKQQFTSCDYCGASDDLSLDHVIPLSRGGQNTIGNINILCRSCNASKNDKTHEEYTQCQK